LRAAVRLAPRGDAHSMGDSVPLALFTCFARQLGQRKQALLFARGYAGADRRGPHLRQVSGGPFVANEGFDADAARGDLAAGNADAVASGKPFIANPDLPRRVAARAPLNVPDPARFYEGGALGYTDYPDPDLVLTTP